MFGGRGPYVEMTEAQMQLCNTHLITDVRHVYFHEYRSDCSANVMVYLQRRTISYADYRIGLYYISPFDLQDENGHRTATVETKGEDSEPGR